MQIVRDFAFREHADLLSGVIETQRETDSENTEGYLMASAPAISLYIFPLGVITLVRSRCHWLHLFFKSNQRGELPDAENDPGSAQHQ